MPLILRWASFQGTALWIDELGGIKVMGSIVFGYNKLKCKREERELKCLESSKWKDKEMELDLGADKELV